MLLFGSIATRKTFLIRSSLGENTFVIDLLKQQFYLELYARLYMLEQWIGMEIKAANNYFRETLGWALFL